MKATRNRDHLGRLLRPFGVGMFGVPTSAPAAPLTPAALTPALWLRAQSGTVFSDGGSTLAINTDPVTRWIQPGDNGVSPAFTRADASISAEPTLEIASGRYYVHGGTNLSMALSAAVACAADFVAYAVVKYVPVAETALKMATSATVSELSISTDDQPVTVLNVGDEASGVAQFSYTASGIALIRIKRTGTTVSMAATGIAETSQTLAGSIVLETLLVNSGSTYSVGELLIFTAAAGIPTAPQLALLDQTGGYFDTNAYLGSTAWGVSL